MERSEGSISTYVYTGERGRENIDRIINFEVQWLLEFFYLFCSSEDFIPMVAVCSIFGIIWFDRL